MFLIAFGLAMQTFQKSSQRSVLRAMTGSSSKSSVLASLFRLLVAGALVSGSIAGHVHPKTLIEMWIICLDSVSANSEKGSGSEWAVRVGQRLLRDSGRAEQPEK